jgi:hypothetical protein
VISESESVGSFVNRALRSGVLTLAPVAVWLLHWTDDTSFVLMLVSSKVIL